jgi:hypothetical protein
MVAVAKIFSRHQSFDNMTFITLLVMAYFSVHDNYPGFPVYDPHRANGVHPWFY